MSPQVRDLPGAPLRLRRGVSSSKFPVQSGNNAGSPKFSPDGRWLAYCTNESGRPEVYVKGFPSGAKVLISSKGGNDPVWRRDGRELFYRDRDRMMAVPVSAGDTFDAGRPQELWRGRYSHGMSSSCGAPGLSSSNYDVTIAAEMS